MTVYCEECRYYFSRTIDMHTYEFCEHPENIHDLEPEAMNNDLECNYFIHKDSIQDGEQPYESKLAKYLDAISNFENVSNPEPMPACTQQEKGKAAFRLIQGGSTGREVDGSRVKEYVFSKLTFKIDNECYSAIDKIIGDVWNNSKILFSKNDCLNALSQLKKKNILLSYERSVEVVDLIFKYLEMENYISPE